MYEDHFSIPLVTITTQQYYIVYWHFFSNF